MSVSRLGLTLDDRARQNIRPGTMASLVLSCHYQAAGATRAGIERRHMIRFVLALALSLAMLPAAWAQEGGPDKPMRVIVPLPAGAAVDVVGRLIMSRL